MESLKLIADHVALKMWLKVIFLIRELKPHGNKLGYLTCICYSREIFLKNRRNHQGHTGDMIRTVNNANLCETKITKNLIILSQRIRTYETRLKVLVLGKVNVVDLNHPIA